MSAFPQLFRVRQHRERPVVDDVAVEVQRQLVGLHLGNTIRPGQSVAVTAGSRGIANIAAILRTVVGFLKTLGAEPFLIPAMGSHGGGTADGQVAVLARYGITEGLVGCPIRATMETVVLCQSAEGFPVHFDRFAYEADHVFVCGRIKAHTKFSGPVESGLLKMLLIGLGKRTGAEIYHRAIEDFDFEQIVRSVGREVLQRCSILAGLAILENPYDETGRLQAVLPAEFFEVEKALLLQANAWLPRLPFERADVLLVDEMGKNFSGSGMDANVVGRKPGSTVPLVKRIIVRALSEETHGNATGLGFASFCKQRVVEQLDAEATRINCVTASHPEAARVPLAFDSDRAVLEAALSTIGLSTPHEARLLWIPNTLELEEVECSVAYWDEAQKRDDLECLTAPRDLTFDTDGELVPLNGAGDTGGAGR